MNVILQRTGVLVEVLTPDRLGRHGTEENFHVKSPSFSSG